MNVGPMDEHKLVVVGEVIVPLVFPFPYFGDHEGDTELGVILPQLLVDIN